VLVLLFLKGSIIVESSLSTLLAIQILLVFLNAIFASAEIAIITVNDNKLASMAEKGDVRAARLVKLTSQPARFLATIQVAITLSGFLGSAFAAENFSDSLVDLMVSMGVPGSVQALNTIAVVTITIILSYVTLVFGELVPKRIAMRKSESMALGLSGLVSVIAKVFAPIVGLLTFSTNIILRLFGIDPDHVDDEVSEEEIRMMVDVGSAKGTIDKHEREFIQNVFEFDDITAEEIATHRTEVAILWVEDSLEQWEETIHNNPFTVYPVCEDSADNVLGIVNIKDYFRHKNLTKEEVMQNVVQPAYFVPGSVRADNLFRNMKANRVRLAVVLDEYGGMSGIITMNDLIEQLVGDLDDDEDVIGENQLMVEVEEGLWSVQGQIDLHEVAEKLNLWLPTDDYDTFGGMVFGVLGSIPDDGVQFELDAYGLRIKVVEIEDHRIEKALVKIL
jgi:putative hemolysin